MEYTKSIETRDLLLRYDEEPENSDERVLILKKIVKSLNLSFPSSGKAKWGTQSVKNQASVNENDENVENSTLNEQLVTVDKDGQL